MKKISKKYFWGLISLYVFISSYFMVANFSAYGVKREALKEDFVDAKGEGEGEKKGEREGWGEKERRSTPEFPRTFRYYEDCRNYRESREGTLKKKKERRSTPEFPRTFRYYGDYRDHRESWEGILKKVFKSVFKGQAKEDRKENRKFLRKWVQQMQSALKDDKDANKDPGLLLQLSSFAKNLYKEYHRNDKSMSSVFDTLKNSMLKAGVLEAPGKGSQEAVISGLSAAEAELKKLAEGK